MENSKTCCFSGHRDVSIYDDNISKLLLAAVDQKIREGFTNFIVGGARGFDMLAAIVVSKFKRNGYPVKLVFALPCKGYTKNWTEKERAVQDVLFHLADRVVAVSTEYDNACMFKRNRYMVDHSDALICYLNRQRGGTAYTKKYAEKKGIEIINLYQ